MLIHYDPDEFKTVSERRTCAFHEINPGESYAGCTCSYSCSSVRREPEEIAAIKAERRRKEEDRILAKAELIKYSRSRAQGKDTHE